MSGSLETVVLIAEDKLKKFELYFLFVKMGKVGNQVNLDNIQIVIWKSRLAKGK